MPTIYGPGLATANGLLPKGGVSPQALLKTSATDYATGWSNIGGAPSGIVSGDFNTLQTFGVYQHSGGSPTNGPPASYPLMLSVFGQGGGTVVQQATDNVGVTYMRTNPGGTWTPWRRLVADFDPSDIRGRTTAMTSPSTASIAGGTVTNVTGWGPDPDATYGDYWYTGTPGGAVAGGPASQPGVVIFTMSGLYLCIARVTMAAAAAACRKNTRLQKNNAGAPAGPNRESSQGTAASMQTTIEVSAIFEMSVYDTLAVQAWQNSGAAVALTGNHYWQITRLGPLVS